MSDIRFISWSGYCLTDYCITCSGSNNTCSGIYGYYADANWLDVGYNMLAFLGEQYSKFDYNLHSWVPNTNTVKAEDLAKSVCSKYNLVWDDRTDINWIGNVIDYIRTYDEEEKRFRLYKPSITPENNVNNPYLVIKDELNETQLRGLQILVASGIDMATDGSLGVIMEFR